MSASAPQSADIGPEPGRGERIKTSEPRVPKSDALKRLTVETAEFLGNNPGESVPVQEVREQAKANGYSSDEIQAMLAENGLLGAENVRIPPRDDLFGDIWQVQGLKKGNSVCTDPAKSTPGRPGDMAHTRAESAESGADDPARDVLETSREWCQSKLDKRFEAAKERLEADADDPDVITEDEIKSASFPVDHAFSRRAAGKQFARIKDAERYAVKHWDWFSTVHVVRNIEREPGENIAEHAERYNDRAFSRYLRTSLRELDVYEDFAGVALLAPHEPGDLNRRVGYSVATHEHRELIIPGIAFEGDFSRLRNADGDIHIDVRRHRSEDVETPEDVLRRGSGLDAERGPTTALAQELGRNLPMLRCKLDARGLREPIEYWAACMRLGIDGDIQSKGIKTFRPMRNGRSTIRFNEYAQSVRNDRKEQAEQAVRDAVQSAQALADALKSGGHERSIEPNGGVLKRSRESPIFPAPSPSTPGVRSHRPPFRGVPPPEPGRSDGIPS